MSYWHLFPDFREVNGEICLLVFAAFVNNLESSMFPSYLYRPDFLKSMFAAMISISNTTDKCVSLLYDPLNIVEQPEYSPPGLSSLFKALYSLKDPLEVGIL